MLHNSVDPHLPVEYNMHTSPLMTGLSLHAFEGVVFCCNDAGSPIQSAVFNKQKKSVSNLKLDWNLIDLQQPDESAAAAG